MVIKIYLMGCAVAFCLGWMQADKEGKTGDISQFGAVMVVITLLSWVYVAYWLYWYNSGGGPKLC
jgi:hypothetical protein